MTLQHDAVDEHRAVLDVNVVFRHAIDPGELCVATCITPHVGQDYHFTPCAASISLWSGKLYSSPAFPVKPAPATVEEPKPTSPGKKEAPPPELEQKPKKKEIENKYNTEGGCRLVLGSKEGIVHLYESSTRVSTWNGKEDSTAWCTLRMPLDAHVLY